MKSYEHSGAVPPAGLLLALVSGAVAALVLGFIYAYAIAYIPLIYVNFFLTLGFGFALGFVAGMGAYFGKIRNTLVAYVLGFVVGVMGLYVEWAVSLPAMFGGEAGYAFAPAKLMAYAEFLYANGSWGLRGGDNVSGIFLAIIWLVEAGMIVGLSVFASGAAVADHPFCESCRVWTDKSEDVRRLAVLEGQADLVERLSTGDLSVLSQLPQAPESLSSYLQLDLATCPKCPSSCYISASLVMETVDSDGDVQKHETPLLKHYNVHSEDLELVRNAGREITDEERAELGMPVLGAAAKETEPPAIPGI